jgi:hypothetical protein
MAYFAYDKARRAEAEKSAERNFKRHVLTKEGEGRWLFRDPDCQAFWFRVVAAPRTIMMFGDTGGVMLHPSDWDALGWLRGVVGGYAPGKWDIGYVAEKVEHKKDIMEFQTELIARYIAELREELAGEVLDYEKEQQSLDEEDRDKEPPEEFEERQEAIDDLDGYYESSADFYDAWHDMPGIDPAEPPSVEGLTWHFLHQVAGLHYFCKALDQYEKDHPNEPSEDFKKGQEDGAKRMRALWADMAGCGDNDEELPTIAQALAFEPKVSTS